MENKELLKALEIDIPKGELPTDAQLLDASKKWKSALNSPYRLEADKDFLAGAIWGINLMRKNLPELQV